MLEEESDADLVAEVSDCGKLPIGGTPTPTPVVAAALLVATEGVRPYGVWVIVPDESPTATGGKPKLTTPVLT